MRLYTALKVDFTFLRYGLSWISWNEEASWRCHRECDTFEMAWKEQWPAAIDKVVNEFIEVVGVSPI